LCLNVTGSSTSGGAGIIQWACQSANALNDQWDLNVVGIDADKQLNQFHVVSASSGMCLNIDGGSVAPGATVIQWTCQDAGSANDQFVITTPQPSSSTFASPTQP
jgi:Ricin-type beta-trefoil lectin domain-like